MEYVYRFPVVRGLQAAREYYIAMVPLRMLSKLFPTEEEYVLPEYRAQRKINGTRIPDISRYILNNRDSYVFSALAASIDGEYKYVPSAENHDVGALEVAMDAKFLINDGQHRKAAILEAINEDESLLDETISVVFFEDHGLARSQQMFTDLNKHAVKTSNSIAELYDARDPLAVATRNVISQNGFFNMYTDKEKDILGKYSSNLFTLNTFYNANKRIVRSAEMTEDVEAFLHQYWGFVSSNIVPWQELLKHNMSKIDLRENYLITQSVMLQAIGRVGNAFFTGSNWSLAKSAKALQRINWRRNADCWRLRVIRPNGRMINSETAIILAANVIKLSIGIELDADELEREDRFRNVDKIS